MGDLFVWTGFELVSIFCLVGGLFFVYGLLWEVIIYLGYGQIDQILINNY
jgi:hypothetical protein